MVCKRLKLQNLVINRNFSRYPEHQARILLSIKHVIQFHYLASSTREVILEKKPLKDCNGSREAVYIQTRYFSISFAKKNTNKQTERTLTGTPQQLWPITAGSDTYIKKPRNIKKHSDTRKTTAIYNKLLDETRDQHYYILNR